VKKTADPEAKTFESLMADLEDVVQRLEDETLSLDEAIELHGRAQQLVDQCRTRLGEAEQTIQKLITGTDGNIQVEDLDTISES